MHGNQFPRWLAIAVPLVIATTFGSNHIVSTVAALMLAAGMLTRNLALPSNPGAWLGLGLLMLFYGTAFTALFVLLPRLDALNNSAALNFEPIAVLFLAWPILGQSVAPRQIVGALVVVGAVIALGTAKR